MAQLTLEVFERTERGKNAMRRIRAAGRIPGVLYGDGKEPVVLEVDPESLDEIISSHSGLNTIFDLALAGAGKRRPAMIHDLQRHPLRQSVMHADFIRINKERKLHVRVHIELDGLPEGVKTHGGILEFPHRDVGIECLPDDIPDVLRVDVSELMVGQSIRVRELPFDATKVRLLDDPDTVVALVALPAAEKETAETTEDEEPTEELAAEETDKPKEDDESAS